METNTTQIKGYGLCLEDPVRLTSISLEYVYLSKIISPAGTPFVFSGMQYLCTGMVDCLSGHYLDASGNKVEVCIYLHAYNKMNDIRPPEGWTMSAMEVPKSLRHYNACRKGCLVPFVLTIGTIVSVCFTVCHIVI